MYKDFSSIEKSQRWLKKDSSMNKVNNKITDLSSEHKKGNMNLALVRKSFSHELRYYFRREGLTKSPNFDINSWAHSHVSHLSTQQKCNRKNL